MRWSENILPKIYDNIRKTNLLGEKMIGEPIQENLTNPSGNAYQKLWLLTGIDPVFNHRWMHRLD